MSLTTQRYQICQSFNEYSSKCDCLSLLNRLFKSLLHFQSFSHISTLKVFAALIEDGTYNWTDEELAMVASQNLINTFRFCYLPSFGLFLSFCKQICGRSSRPARFRGRAARQLLVRLLHT